MVKAAVIIGTVEQRSRRRPSLALWVVTILYQVKRFLGTKRLS